MATSIDPALVAAYLATEYRVGTPEFGLRIGKRSEELAAEHRVRGVGASAFVTACNPFSMELTDEQNAARHRDLCAELQSRGLAFIEGIGEPVGDWKGEPSVLILGISREQASELGRRYEQNAIVWSGADAVPELVLLR
jgi:hypothetical protein